VGHEAIVIRSVLEIAYTNHFNEFL
jgi:hypothetical protein